MKQSEARQFRAQGPTLNSPAYNSTDPSSGRYLAMLYWQLSCCSDRDSGRKQPLTTLALTSRLVPGITEPLWALPRNMTSSPRCNSISLPSLGYASITHFSILAAAHCGRDDCSSRICCLATTSAWNQIDGCWSRAKKKEIGRDLLKIKRPTFHHNCDFKLTVFSRQFDCLLAQSIFSHAAPQQIDVSNRSKGCHAFGVEIPRDVRARPREL